MTDPQPPQAAGAEPRCTRRRRVTGPTARRRAIRCHRRLRRRARRRRVRSAAGSTPAGATAPARATARHQPGTPQPGTAAGLPAAGLAAAGLPPPGTATATPPAAARPPVAAHLAHQDHRDPRRRAGRRGRRVRADLEVRSRRRRTRRRRATRRAAGRRRSAAGRGAKPRFTASDGSFSVEYPAHDSVFDQLQEEQRSSSSPNSATAAAILRAGRRCRRQDAAAGRAVLRCRAKFPDARAGVPDRARRGRLHTGLRCGLRRVPAEHVRRVRARPAGRCCARSRTTPTCSWSGSAPTGRSTRGDPHDHPTGVATRRRLFMDPIVNSVRWKGDPAR